MITGIRQKPANNDIFRFAFPSEFIALSISHIQCVLANAWNLVLRFYLRSTTVFFLSSLCCSHSLSFLCFFSSLFSNRVCFFFLSLFLSCLFAATFYLPVYLYCKIVCFHHLTFCVFVYNPFDTHLLESRVCVCWSHLSKPIWWWRIFWRR